MSEVVKAAAGLLLVALALYLSPVSAEAFRPLGHGFGGGGGEGSYSGPCDVITGGCAEAWSVDRAMTSAYSGPLLQIALFSSPSMTTNITQTGAHAANMSGVLSFCGGTYSNCAISIIYAQIQGTGNNSVPSVFNANPFGPNCSGGGLNCACPLQVNGTTGLPQVPLDSTTFSGLNCEYTLASDGTATGITGGNSSSVSEFFTGTAVQVAAQCCATVLISHAYNGADTPGTDFGMGFQYTNTGSFGNCVSANVFCQLLDIESNTLPAGNSLGSSVLNVIGFASWNEPANIVSGEVNGHLSWTPQIPQSSMNPSTHVHFGGGGDLSQPAPSIMFDVAFTNNANASGDQAAYQANTEAFFSGLTFP
jgi:hypothetical protein